MHKPRTDPGGSFELLVQEVAEAADAVLARVWLPGPGDRCASCPMAYACAERTWCLHLEAGAGAAARGEGRFARVPTSFPRVGDVARLGTPLVAVAGLDRLGFADAAWLATHQVRSFVAVPIPAGPSRHGVLAVFSRRTLGPGDAELLALAASWAARAAAARDREPTRSPGRASASTPSPPNALPPPPPTPPGLRPLAETEREAIEHVLHHTGGRVSGPRGAAVILGLKPTTLESRIKKLGIRKPRP
jgi:hypothetical protein